MEVEVCEGQFQDEAGQGLYYIRRGEGLPVIFCNGIGVSTASFWPPVLRALSEYVCAVGWDYAGHGRSPAAVAPEQLSIALCAHHLAQLMDRLEIPKAVIAGHSMGSQVAFEFYRHYPERVLGLIPTLGTFEKPFNNFLRFSRSAEIFEQISQQVLRHPELVETVWPHLFHSLIAQPFSRKVGFVHPTLLSRKELDIYLSHLRVLSPVSFFYLARDMQEHSAADLLEDIEVPTLILAARKDLFTPIEASYEMHDRIAGSELMVVRDGSHAALAEQPELFWLRIRRFLARHFPDQVVT